MSDTQRVLVFTATYDERDNIEDFCRRVLALDRPDAGRRVDLLVVDDSSPDGTGRLLDRLATADPRIIPVHRPRKLGLGSAHKLAMIHAIQNGYDRLVTLDADFSHDPGQIPELLSLVEDGEFATGSRYAPGGRCDYKGYRRAVSVAANIAARLLLGIPLHEFTTSFRAFRVDVLRQVDISSIRSQGYSFFLESLYRLKRTGCRYRELPIHFRDRRAGRSKIPRLEIFRGRWKLLALVADRAFGGRRSRRNPELLDERCLHCDSPYLFERFPPRGDTEQGDQTYRCTSMDHRSKPRVVACLACGTEFVLPRDVHPHLEALYADVVDDGYLEQRSGREKTFRRAYDAIAPQLRPDGGRMLEVGAYCGLFLVEARRRGWRVEGVEPSRWAATQAREEHGLDIHCGTVDDGAFPAAERRHAYDAIVMWDVLEHIERPRDLLEHLRELLTEDGVLCFSTLDIENWFPRLTGRHWPWIMQMHIQYFGVESMREILCTAGLRLDEVKPYCHYISVKYFVEKVASLLPRPLAAALRPLRAISPNRIHIPFRFGDIKLYVARRATAPLPETATVALPAAAEPGLRRARAGS